MSRQVVVTATATISWDVDEYRKMWDDESLTDDQIAEECLGSMRDNWDDYLASPETLDFEVALV